MRRSGLLNQVLEEKQRTGLSSLLGWWCPPPPTHPCTLTVPEMDFSESIVEVTYFSWCVLPWKVTVAPAGARRSHFLVTHKYLFPTGWVGRARFLLLQCSWVVCVCVCCVCEWIIQWARAVQETESRLDPLTLFFFLTSLYLSLYVCTSLVFNLFLQPSNLLDNYLCVVYSSAYWSHFRVKRSLDTWHVWLKGGGGGQQHRKLTSLAYFMGVSPDQRSLSHFFTPCTSCLLRRNTHFLVWTWVCYHTLQEVSASMGGACLKDIFKHFFLLEGRMQRIANMKESR